MTTRGMGGGNTGIQDQKKKIEQTRENPRTENRKSSNQEHRDSNKIF